jgi:hypothetical protein
MKFSGPRISLEIFFKIQGFDCEFLDRGLITEKPRDLPVRFLGKSRIKNIFCEENLVDSVHGL